MVKKIVGFNTDKRKNVCNNFEKDFFKLENLRKRICVELINNAKNYAKYVSRPSFVSQKIFSKTFVAVHRIQPVLTLKHKYTGTQNFYSLYVVIIFAHHGYLCQNFFIVIETP